MAILILLQTSTLLLSLRLTVKQGTNVSGPISLKYTMAATSCEVEMVILWCAFQLSVESNSQMDWFY